VSDIFEADELRSYEKFVNVDHEDDGFALLLRIIMKSFRLAWFLASLVWRARMI
jgi:hypothetical protein